jgi:membrane-bound serine protease (ClpP class)
VLTIIAILLALTVLPSPWGIVAVIVGFAIDAAETTFFVRWSKRRRATVGVETLVGRTAVVVRALSPRGQVKLDGEVWEARGPAGVLRGEEVVVIAVDGLVLDVEPSSEPA